MAIHTFIGKLGEAGKIDRGFSGDKCITPGCGILLLRCEEDGSGICMHCQFDMVAAEIERRRQQMFRI